METSKKAELKEKKWHQHSWNTVWKKIKPEEFGMFTSDSLFINMTRGIQYLDEIKELLLEGFESALDDGPIAKKRSWV